MAVSQAQFKATLGKSSGMSKVPTKSSYNNLAGVFGSVVQPKTTSYADVNALIASFGAGGQTKVPTGGGQSYAPFYPTPTGAPIPTTISAGKSSSSSGGGSVLGSSTVNIPTTMTSSTLSSPTNLSSGFSSGASMIGSVPSAPTTSSVAGNSFDMSSLLTPDLVSKGASIVNGQIVYNQDQLGKDNADQNLSPLEKALKLGKENIKQPRHCPNSLHFYP